MDSFQKTSPSKKLRTALDDEQESVSSLDSSASYPDSYTLSIEDFEKRICSELAEGENVKLSEIEPYEDTVTSFEKSLNQNIPEEEKVENGESSKDVEACNEVSDTKSDSSSSFYEVVDQYQCSSGSSSAGEIDQMAHLGDVTNDHKRQQRRRLDTPNYNSGATSKSLSRLSVKDIKARIRAIDLELAVLDRKRKDIMTNFQNIKMVEEEFEKDEDHF